MIIGLFLRHIKAYKGIKYIPIGEKYNFISYIGENGAGKSSILEGFNSFFNSSPYNINKTVLSEGVTTANYEPFFAPIFLIPKESITKQKKQVEILSEYFWNVKRTELSPGIIGSMKDFLELRDNIIQYKDTHHLLIIGEINLTLNKQLYFGSFQREEGFLTKILNKNQSELTKENRKELLSEWRAELSKLVEKSDWKKTLQMIKNMYSFVYLPVEIDIQSFTKIETEEMQKIFDKKLKDEIETALENVNLDRKDGINLKLNDFIKEISKTLNNEYKYQTGKQRNNNVTKADLINKIIEVYFEKRLLYKIDGKIEKKVSELSAGEKRQALIDLVYAFLLRAGERETNVIIAIDEPENSLHTTSIYNQFEKLKLISKENQIMITTHWYGYLPIISKGYAHFVSDIEDKIDIRTYDLYDYNAVIKKEMAESKNLIPNNFRLKSTYDLVQSIFYSITKNNEYNWIICEGISEKIYFEYFFKEEIDNKKLRILPMGGASKVLRLCKYLETPVKDTKNEIMVGKIFCLIDTDQDRCEELVIDHNNLKIKRLSNKGSNFKTHLLSLNAADTSVTDIEQSLNPQIFQLVMEELTDHDSYKVRSIENNNGNTDFINNLRNLDIKDYFKENNGDNKIAFAKKYVEICKENKTVTNIISPWIKEIKKFFNGK